MKDKAHKNRINVPEWIFAGLNDDSLLRKCLHGETQNANEALNNIIWLKCPKNIYIQRPVFEMGVNSAILEYNLGANGIQEVFNYFSSTTGKFTSSGSAKRDSGVRFTKRKSSEHGKTQRKKLRSIKKGFSDKEMEEEVVEAYVCRRILVNIIDDFLCRNFKTVFDPFIYFGAFLSLKQFSLIVQY